MGRHGGDLWDAGWIRPGDHQLGESVVTGLVWPDGIGVTSLASCVSAA
jgi:hypothetical protein